MGFHEKIAPTFWILGRAGGVTAYLLLTTAVLLGLCVRTRVLSRVRPVVVVDLHRLISALALGAVAVHITGLYLDANKPTTLLQYAVPGLMAYRPAWTGTGVVVAELMLVVHLSFRFRSRIGARNWRRLHWATYLAYGGATVHGLASGSDSATPWARAVYITSLGAVVGLTAWRALSPRPAARPRPPASVPRPTDGGAS